MKKIITALLISFFGVAAFSSPLAVGIGVTMGVPNGTYLGTGKLMSDNHFVPNLSFQSVRRLQDGVIQARTEAFLLGMKVAEASATLHIQMRDAENFDMLDMTNNNAICGSGFCRDGYCRFSASVMQGKLELNETWIANEDGFRVIHASQNFSGLRSTYQGTFRVQ